MSNPVDSALNVLEDRIGKPSGSGQAETITYLQKSDVISWCLLKGMSRKSLERCSLETLGKLYGIPNYLSSAIRNDKFAKKSSGIQAFDPPNPNTNHPNPFPVPNTKSWEEEENTHDQEEEQKSLPGFSLNQRQIETLVRSSVSSLLRQEIESSRTQIQAENKNLEEKIISGVIKALDKDRIDSENRINTLVSTQLNLGKEKIQEDLNLFAKKIEENQESYITKIINEALFKGRLSKKIEEKEQEFQIIPESLELNLENLDSSIPQEVLPYIPSLDPNYHFDPYATKVIRSALESGENLYVYGDTGCGKTTHLEQVCSVLNRGISRINPHDGVTREMFLGSMKLINSETIFVEGALPRAMKLGLIFLVDEISFLPPNLTAILNPIMEPGGKLYIPETCEFISPHPDFCIFATDNTGGKGDRTGNYSGTEVQNTATLDRFAFCLKMDYLPQDKELEMLQKRFPKHNQAEIRKLLSFAIEVRQAFSRGELAITFSTRKLIKFFSQRSNFSLQESLQNTILAWLDEDDKNLITTILDRLQILEEEVAF